MDGEKGAVRKEGKTVDITLYAPNHHRTMCRIPCPHGLSNELLAMERNLLVGIGGLEGAGEGFFSEPQERRSPWGHSYACMRISLLISNLLPLQVITQFPLQQTP